MPNDRTEKHPRGPGRVVPSRHAAASAAGGADNATVASNAFKDQQRLETYKSLITISTDGFKYLALTNGGAAVAIVSYMAAVSKAGAVTSSPAGITLALAGFLGGVALCGIAQVFAYLTQLTLLGDMRREDDPKSHQHPWLLMAAGITYVLSLICFCFGCGVAVGAFGL